VSGIEMNRGNLADATGLDNARDMDLKSLRSAL
jgi:hypothetical protein